MLMIAGPNGAGKTTLTRWLRKQGIDFGEYINPDEIAEALGGNYEQRTVQAQGIADQLRADCLKAGRSFSFETVMSHESKIDILARAREAGFFVQLFYVGTDDPNTNIDRVELRVAQGGHDVPRDRIVSRWVRSMEKLSNAIRSSDAAFIFDNSIAGTIEEPPRLVFYRTLAQDRGRPWSEQYVPVPRWISHYVLRPLGIAPTQVSRRVRQSIVKFPGAEPVETEVSTKKTLSQEASSTDTHRHFSHALSSVFESAARAVARDGAPNTVMTGLSDLDHVLGGLQRSNLIILAGRAGMGKTLLAAHIAFNAARRLKLNADEDANKLQAASVGFFSLEMSAEQIATRVISAQANVPTNRIYSGNIAEHEFDRMVTVAREIEMLPLFIDDTGGISIMQIRSRALRLKEQRGLDLLIVDTAEALQRSTERASERADSASPRISADLKLLAHELGAPVLLTSRLPALSGELDGRPRLADVDDTFEQDADVILLLFREELDLEERKPSRTYDHSAWQTEIEATRGRIEILVRKNRNGPLGTIHASFDAATGRFAEAQV